MKKRLKVLTLCVASLTLSGTVSGCSATWNEVQDFLNGMYTTTNGWEGMKYEYTYESYIKTKVTADNGDVTKDTINMKSSSSVSYKYKDGVTYMNQINKYEEKSNEDTYSENENIYCDESGEYVKFDSSSSDEVHYGFYRNLASMSQEKSNLTSDLNSLVYTYGNTSKNGNNFNVISSSVSGHSVSWTMSMSQSEKHTITIKTDKDNVVNYYCSEYSYINNDEELSLDIFDSYTIYGTNYIKEVYEKINGGKISKPSWVNKNNFSSLK